MPKPKINVSRRKQRNRRFARRRLSRKTGARSAHTTTVHRRLVLFPDVEDSSWLKTLTWFASVALKLIALVAGVSDDLEATGPTVGSGTVVILGPGDFAALSPLSVPVVVGKAKTNQEVKCLKTYPFERAALKRVNIRISPSVDLGSRGGMYAAVIIPIDSTDSAIISDRSSDNIEDIIKRYSYDYDDIIKNPKARMSPVTKTLTLSINLSGTFHNIRTMWSETLGYVNSYPTCALCIAFSDMASKVTDVASNYAPNKSLFEVHLTGELSFSEPGELVVNHDSGGASVSCFTPKLFTSTMTRLTTVLDRKIPVLYKFFDWKFETNDGRLKLISLPLHQGEEMLKHFGKEHLIPKLKEMKLAEDFQML